MVNELNQSMKRKGEKDVLAVGVLTPIFNSQLTCLGFQATRPFFETLDFQHLSPLFYKNCCFF